MNDQLNLEYWFREIYELFHGGWSVSSITSAITGLWIWISIVGYILTVFGLAVIVYCIMQLFELRAREAAAYGIVHVAKDEGPKNARWQQIEQLMASESTSQWREAIIEADILLAETLTREGYIGDSVGDQLKQIDAAEFPSLNDAWEAHKVRNEIAHTGSSFDLSQVVAGRTIARYENVFRDLGVIS